MGNTVRPTPRTAVKTWTVIAMDNQSLPPLQVHAASRRVAVKRAHEAVVKWHCERKGLPYYSAGCCRVEGTQVQEIAFSDAWEGDFTEANADDHYQALRYISGGRRDAQGKPVRGPGVIDPETRPGGFDIGHFVPCGGVFRLKKDNGNNDE